MSFRPRKVIRDYRYEPEKALATRDAVVAAEEAQRGPARVIPPYYPRRPINSGDEFSASGVLVAFEELDADLQALVIAGGGGPGTLIMRELDGSPTINPTTTIEVPNGTLSNPSSGVARLSFRADVDYAGSFESTTIGTGDIGTGKWGWWYNTTTGQLWLVRNRVGTLHYVEATC